MLGDMLPGGTPLYVPPGGHDLISFWYCWVVGLCSLKHENQIPSAIAIRRATPPTTPPAIAPTGVDDVSEVFPCGVGVGVTWMTTVVGRDVDVGDGLVEPGVMEAEGPTRPTGRIRYRRE